MLDIFLLREEMSDRLAPDANVMKTSYYYRPDTSSVEKTLESSCFCWYCSLVILVTTVIKICLV